MRDLIAMQSFSRDLRYGLRVLAANPYYTVVAALTLAIGISANATVFAWIEGIRYHTPSGAQATGRLAVLETVAPNGEQILCSLPDYRDYRDHLRLVEEAAAWRMDRFSLGDPPHTRRIWGQLVTSNFFALYGVKPALGRLFNRDEPPDTPGASPVAVISHRLWRNVFHSDPQWIGKTVRLNRREVTIIGVVPADFRGSHMALAFDVWVPVTMGHELNIFSAGTFRERSNRPFNVAVRLNPGVSVAQAQAEVKAIAHRLAETYPNTNFGLGATLIPYWKSQHGGQLLLSPLRILMAICLVVLLIACANVANLILARSVARQKEFGIRMALGAGRTGLVRQLLAESLTLAGVGALLSVPLTYWMREALMWLVPPSGYPIEFQSGLNLSSAGFTAFAAAVTAILAGTAPALYAGRFNVNETLKEGGRSGTASSRSHRLRALLVVSEIALATITLIAAGLFVKRFRDARDAYPGFDASHVLVSQFFLPGYSNDESRQFCIRLRQRLESAPGITSVTYTDTIPLGFGLGPWHDVRIDGYQPGPNENMKIYRTLTDPGYFRVMRIPMLEGRDFTDRDDRSAPLAMIVTESFVHRFFGGRNPVGRKVRVAGKEATVVGVVKDTRHFDPLEQPMPFFYLPFQQQYQAGVMIAFLVRSAGQPDDLIATVRREAVAVDPEAGAFEAMPLTEFMGGSTYPRKIAATLLAGLGILALVLSGVGLYSVMSYMVSQRTQEMGIRMALGAHPRNVVAVVLRQGLSLTAAGLLIGSAVTVVLSRVAATVLGEVSFADPVTFLGPSVFLGAIALLACYVPARRATQVDPLVALRYQ